ncbi:PRC-barrel domain-containing protein [Actinobaculum suis]|uniref:PRC-barrel domain-containing protein n=1 Tax=Actinobaculum suis TaxID=1657 RepID=UPI001147682A|nr:PRC-barrel domain-containing protein [Actinobaculum suis]
MAEKEKAAAGTAETTGGSVEETTAAAEATPGTSAGENTSPADEATGAADEATGAADEATAAAEKTQRGPTAPAPTPLDIVALPEATAKEITALLDRVVRDNAGEKIGRVKDVFVDNETQEPVYALITHGRLHLSTSLVPIAGLKLDTSAKRPFVACKYAAETILSAPEYDPALGLTEEVRAAIAAHYAADTAASSAASTAV